MADAEPVPWVETTAGATPSAASRAALDAWARARGLKLVRPSPAATNAPRLDWQASDAVEEALRAAREALGAQDAAAVDIAVARAVELLEANAALPHAAFLQAEVDRVAAARHATLEPRDSARADALLRRAAALDGGRASAVGEAPFVAPGAPVPFVLTGAGAELRWNGSVHLAAYAATDRFRLLWAGWVEVAPGAAVGPALPAAAPCSAEDLAARNGTGGAGPRCPRWVSVRVVRRGDGESVFAALCGGPRCAPATAALGGGKEPRRWPWLAVGASAALLAAVAAAVTVGVVAATSGGDAPPPGFTGGGLEVARGPMTPR